LEGQEVTEEEVDLVAQEMAKVGGVSWYPGRTSGGLLRNVGERYRDRARVAIAALDRLRAGKDTSEVSVPSGSGETASKETGSLSSDNLEIGAVVVYRPPGDQRAISCQVTQIEDGRVYLVPCPRPDVGWVAIDSAAPVDPTKVESAG
jgi:hypothetical protein